MSYLLILMFSFVFIGCNKNNDDDINEEPVYPIQLTAPANLTVSVVDRLMTVTWDAVENATGYEITTTSVGCTSGSKIVNTVTKTATLHNGNPANCTVSATPVTNNSARGGGQVTIINDTSITIWLMAQENTAPFSTVMASSVKAKIKSFGDNDLFTDSEYSAEVTLNKADYQ